MRKIISTGIGINKKTDKQIQFSIPETISFNALKAFAKNVSITEGDSISEIMRKRLATGTSPNNNLAGEHRYERTIFRKGMFTKQTFVVEVDGDGREYAIAEIIGGKEIQLPNRVPFFALEYKPEPESLRTYLEYKREQDGLRK